MQKDMQKWLYGVGVLAACVVMTGCGHEHTWTEATCAAPKTCSECGETEGKTLAHTWTKAIELDIDARKVYADTLRNLLYSDILPDGSQTDFSGGGAYSQFAVNDVDGDGKEELILLYDSGVMASSAGYIIGYDTEMENIYIQLEEFPFFAFLENGNLKALCSHNQTYGEMWPYILYQYLPESDSYKLAGYAHAEDKAAFEANGVPERYPDAADISDTGTVYYVGSDAWGTNPMDEADYIKWLEENHGNASEREIEYLLLTEENLDSLF